MTVPVCQPSHRGESRHSRHVSLAWLCKVHRKGALQSSEAELRLHSPKPQTRGPDSGEVGGVLAGGSFRSQDMVEQAYGYAFILAAHAAARAAGVA